MFNIQLQYYSLLMNSSIAQIADFFLQSEVFLGSMNQNPTLRVMQQQLTVTLTQTHYRWIPLYPFTMATGRHYITMLLADCITSLQFLW